MMYEPATYPSLADYEVFAYAPVVAGWWRQHEAWDGTYDFDDLLDAHELLAVKAANEARFAAAAKEAH